MLLLLAISVAPAAANLEHFSPREDGSITQINNTEMEFTIYHSLFCCGYYVNYKVDDTTQIRRWGKYSDALKGDVKLDFGDLAINQYVVVSSTLIDGVRYAKNIKIVTP